MLASAGTAVGEIEVPETGAFAIGVRARGTPCKGTYPMIQFSLGGKPIGTAQLGCGEWQEVGTYGQLRKGRHQLTIAFINDASDPPHEDRNLEVDCVLIGTDDTTVSAVRVEHDPIEYAFGYVFETGGRKLVLSGDTKPCDALI